MGAGMVLPEEKLDNVEAEAMWVQTLAPNLRCF
jgi:hypothetical protein